jgi:hypothetical protein
VFTGFAFEAVTGAANRNALMAAVLAHLGTPSKPAVNAPAPKPLAGNGPPEGVPPVTTPPTTKPPVVTPGQHRLLRIVVARLRKLASLRSKGIPVRVECQEGCKVRVDLVVPSSVRRRYRLISTRIGTATVTLTATGNRTINVRINSQAKRRLRRARTISVTVKAVQLDAKPAVRKSAKVTVTRR